MDIDTSEESLAVSRSSTSDTKFDMIIGIIEEIVMEDEFQMIQHNFLEKYFHEFIDTDENKFIYTDIHREYISLVEKYLNERLVSQVPEFSMSEFMHQMVARKHELEGEIFELLLTFSDFVTFKEMVLDYKAVKEGRTVDLSDGITVTSISADP
ncbi:ADP-ribosylation factor-like protein 2-binding protein [Argonauta hians]